MEILESVVCYTIYTVTAKMKSNFFSTVTIQLMMYILVLPEAKVLTIKGTLGDCQLLNLKSGRKSVVGIHRVVWKKGTALVGKMKDQNATCSLYRERCHIFNNGSLKLCPTLMGDNGQYTAEIFTADGKHMYSQTVQLELTKAKVQEFIIKGTSGDCQLLNLENGRKSVVGIHKVVWKKGTALVGNMEDQNGTTCSLYSERCHVFNNGSLKLCPTLMGDNGQYTAEIFTADGKHMYSQTVQLELTEAEKAATNYSYLLPFILMGVYVATLLVVLGSSTYYFGKRKNKPENKRSTLQKPQTIKTVEEGQLDLFINEETAAASNLNVEEGQLDLFINEEETAAASNLSVEYAVPLKISTFKDNESSSF